MWLTNVGGVEVERITDVKRSFANADRNPPKGVLHTTEGTWSGSLSVFRYNTGTPTFMIGRDGTTRQGVGYNGRLRIAQFMPIGEMALTLKNLSGGVETNRDCLVQIELVAHCQWEPWLPDLETTKLLNKLLIEIERVAHVPLKRGGDGTRSVIKWNSNAGWFGHSEAPENDHTDPRAIRWSEILKPTTVDVGGDEEGEEVFPEWFQKWKPWYITGRPKGVPMPAIPGLPDPIPDWAWDDIELTVQIHRTLGPPLIYQNWRNYRLIGAPQPEGIPLPVSEWWWDGAVIDHAFAKMFADQADDPLQAELALKIQEIVSLQNELASTRVELEEARETDSNRVAALEARIQEVRDMLDAALAKLNAP